MTSAYVKLIRHCSRDIVRELGLLSKEDAYGIPLPIRHALIEIDLHGSLTRMDLCALMKLDKSVISRLVKMLVQKKLVAISQVNKDQRYKSLTLTVSGKKLLEKVNHIADKQVENALLQLSEEEQQKVNEGLELYAKALKRSRIHQDYLIRHIKKQDNVEIMKLIKEVLKEHGADRPGFAFVDPELEDMHKSYSKENSCYLIIERKADKKIMGGVGIGPLSGGEKSICELKKMYLSPAIRGLKLGYSLLQKVLSTASEYGYTKCYLETLKSMALANNLYKQFGFAMLDKPLGNTGHFGCDAWYVKKL